MAVDAGAYADELSSDELDSDEMSIDNSELAAVDYDECAEDEAAVDTDVSPKKGSHSRLVTAGITGLILVITLGSLTGWLGYSAYQAQHLKADHEFYLQVTRQAAINLATIDFRNAEADIQRILDSATGAFHEEFAERSGAFVDVVKNTQSITHGSVSEAGLEYATRNEAQALVAVSVTTSFAGVAEQQPRSWRLRLTLQRQGQDVKISSVGFVS